jgi:signal-transduction protein with cAMP-binding, CBS, and nucleotidyltransferase domain
MPILVKDVMSSPALTIDYNKSVRDAAKLMTKTRKKFLIATKRGKAVGIISDTDILINVVAKNRKGTELKVKNIMSFPIVAVSPEDTILDAVRKIKRNNIHRLPVISKGRVLGVISLSDIARASSEMIDLLEYRLKMKRRPIVFRERETVGFCQSCGNYSENLKSKTGIWICQECRELEE